MGVVAEAGHLAIRRNGCAASPAERREIRVKQAASAARMSVSVLGVRPRDQRAGLLSGAGCTRVGVTIRSWSRLWAFSRPLVSEIVIATEG